MKRVKPVGSKLVMSRYLIMGFASLLACACFEVTIPPEEHLKPLPAGWENDVSMPDLQDTSSSDGVDVQAPNVRSVDSGSDIPPLPLDAPKKPCESLCDCTPGNDCINGVCASSAPIQCCSHPLCDQESPCWDQNGDQGTCET